MNGIWRRVITIGLAGTLAVGALASDLHDSQRSARSAAAQGLDRRAAPTASISDRPLRSSGRHRLQRGRRWRSPQEGTAESATAPPAVDPDQQREDRRQRAETLDAWSDTVPSSTDAASLPRGLPTRQQDTPRGGLELRRP